MMLNWWELVSLKFQYKPSHQWYRHIYTSQPWGYWCSPRPSQLLAYDLWADSSLECLSFSPLANTIQHLFPLKTGWNVDLSDRFHCVSIWTERRSSVVFSKDLHWASSMHNTVSGCVSGYSSRQCLLGDSIPKYSQALMAIFIMVSHATLPDSSKVMHIKQCFPFLAFTQWDFLDSLKLFIILHGERLRNFAILCWEVFLLNWMTILSWTLAQRCESKPMMDAPFTSSHYSFNYYLLIVESDRDVLTVHSI